MFNGARVLGPAIAGITVAKIGEGWCFFANAVSYIAVIVGLLMMQLEPFQRATHTVSPYEHIKEGFDYVQKTAPDDGADHVDRSGEPGRGADTAC